MMYNERMQKKLVEWKDKKKRKTTKKMYWWGRRGSEDNGNKKLVFSGQRPGRKDGECIGTHCTAWEGR